MANSPKTDLDITLRFLPFANTSDETTETLTERRALHVKAILEKINPGALVQLSVQLDRLTNEIRHETQTTEDGELLVNNDQLRAIVARSAIRGFTQAYVNEASALQSIDELEHSMIDETS
jgi:hypothetical protein